MKLFDQICNLFEHALTSNHQHDDVRLAKLDASMLQACTAVDHTAKRLYPSEPSGRKRFVRCLREYYWLIEPMMGVGLDLVQTKFSNVVLKGQTNPPDFADLIYHLHRCNHAHGEEVPVEYSLTKSEGLFYSSWEIGPDCVQMPDRVIWALAAVVVFSRANYNLRGRGGDLAILWGNESYPISEWWGREDDLKPIAAGWNTTRVHMDGLYRLRSTDPAIGTREQVLIIASPPAPPDL